MNLFEIDGELVKADKMTLRELAYKQKNSPMKNIKTTIYIVRYEFI